MTKKRIKRWFVYRFRRMIVTIRKGFKNAAKTMDNRVTLNEIQKPLFDICMRMINDPKTELVISNIDFVFHIENKKHLIIIRPNKSANNEIYTISLVEYKNDSKELSGFVEIPFPDQFTKIIVTRFNKEIQKRMKTKQSSKTTNVASHLKSILGEMN